MRSEVLALVAAAGTDAALLFYAFSHFELFFVLFFGIIVAGGALFRPTLLPHYTRPGVWAGTGAGPASAAQRPPPNGSRAPLPPGPSPYPCSGTRPPRRTGPPRK